MDRFLQTAICAPMLLGAILLGMPGCDKKTIQSGGETQAGPQDIAKGADETDSGGVSPNMPDTSISSESEGLGGLDKTPSEEKVAGNTLTAKADPGTAGRQMEEIRAEELASVAAGLRDVFFAFDSFAITEEGRQALARDAGWMKSNLAAHVKIEGHCDERGTSAYNLVLGEKRAKAVRNYLVELGMAADRLSVVSYGKERPVCTEHAESCYSQNRRGHLVVKTGN